MYIDLRLYKKINNLKTLQGFLAMFTIIGQQRLILENVKYNFTYNLTKWILDENVGLLLPALFKSV